MPQGLSYPFLQHCTDSNAYFIRYVGKLDEAPILSNHTLSISDTGRIIQVKENDGKNIRSFFISRDKPVDLQTQPLTIDRTPDWITFWLLTCVVLYAWLQFTFRTRLNQFFRATFSERFVNQLVREGNLMTEYTGVVLLLIFLSVISLFSFQFGLQLGMIPLQNSLFIIYLKIFIVFSTLIVIKYLAIRVFGYIFKTDAGAKAYQLNTFIFNNATGIFLLPFLILYMYSLSLVVAYIAMAVMVILMLYRLYRSFLIGFSVTRFGVFHLFLYFCTLEILPVFWIIKVLMLYGNAG